MVLHPLWNFSMARPQGGPRSAADKEKSSYKTIGFGTIAEPKIIWLYDMVGQLAPGTLTWKKKVKEMEEVEKIIKSYAGALHCTHAWIIAGPHLASMVISDAGVRQLVDVGSHITARFGTSDDWCLFSSHIYTGENPDGTLFLHRDGSGPNPETWAWGEYPAHLIPPGSQDEARKSRRATPVIHYTLSTRQPNLTQREMNANGGVKKDTKENQQP